MPCISGRRRFALSRTSPNKFPHTRRHTKHRPKENRRPNRSCRQRGCNRNQAQKQTPFKNAAR
ncbi:hypothetical protein NEILACOT_03792 [Neisseria lactamica ATCC 23970]|uniref:Uncharacterized protein n=1 Tax=Neisseria lactamica ATCC 23970 TaxID=546265 RepID=D0W8D9_NEILA|nr:hypothetical protein NEILACOT_03792 [Neisseria lactamica ATCC 23970]